MMRKLLNFGIVFILFVFLFNLQTSISFSGNSDASDESQPASDQSKPFEDAKAKGIERINKIIQHYSGQIEISIGQEDPKYIVMLTALEFLRDEKVEQLSKKIDEIKQKNIGTREGRKGLRGAVNEVLNATDTDALAIVGLKKEYENERLREIAIIAVSVFIFLIILSSLFLSLKEEWSGRLRKSIRPIISLSLTSLVFMISWYGLYKDLIEFKDLFTLLLSLYGPIIGFWFGERSGLKIPGQDERETLTISPGSLPGGKVGEEYKASFSAAAGTPPYTWEIEKGNLPVGLNIDSEGTIRGTPKKQGEYEFTVKATDKSNKIGSKKYKIVIDPKEG